MTNKFTLGTLSDFRLRESCKLDNDPEWKVTSLSDWQKPKISKPLNKPVNTKPNTTDETIAIYFNDESNKIKVHEITEALEHKMILWLVSHCEGRYHRTDYNEIYFQYKNDAIAFKLVFAIG